MRQFWHDQSRTRYFKWQLDLFFYGTQLLCRIRRISASWRGSSTLNPTRSRPGAGYRWKGMAVFSDRNRTPGYPHGVHFVPSTQEDRDQYERLLILAEQHVRRTPVALVKNTRKICYHEGWSATSELVRCRQDARLHLLQTTASRSAMKPADATTGNHTERFGWTGQHRCPRWPNCSRRKIWRVPMPLSPRRTFWQ